MSEYLSKKALLESISEAYQTSLEDSDQVDWEEGYRSALRFVKRTIQSGAFDADDSEIQRLRAALVEIKQLLNEDRENDGAFQSWNHMQAWKVATQAFSTTTEPTGPYTDRRDVTAGINTKGQPFAVAIERNGYTVLHLQPGTERNEGEVEHIVDLLNNRSPEQHLMWEIKGLLEQWDFRGIAEQLESGYDQGVLVELVELCEKLTGAKSPSTPNC